MKANQKGFTLPELIFGIIALGVVAFMIGGGYIALHFIMKFW